LAGFGLFGGFGRSGGASSGWAFLPAVPALAAGSGERSGGRMEIDGCFLIESVCGN